MTDNLLLQHILYKSKYSNLKEFSRACQEYLLQNRVPNWTNEQSLYVRLRDNLIGDSQTIFNKKKDEIRNKYLIKAIGELLFLHPSDVVYLANKKIDKVKQINDLQDQIYVSKRQFLECNSDEYNRKIDCLLKMIQNLNQIINLK